MRPSTGPVRRKTSQQRTQTAAFRYAYDVAPEKHIEAAELLTGGPVENPGLDSLPDALVYLMREVGAPSGIGESGYGEEDIPDIIESALKQQRLLVVAPKAPERGDLEDILRQLSDRDRRDMTRRPARSRSTTSTGRRSADRGCACRWH